MSLFLPEFIRRHTFGRMWSFKHDPVRSTVERPLACSTSGIHVERCREANDTKASTIELNSRARVKSEALGLALRAAAKRHLRRKGAAAAADAAIEVARRLDDPAVLLHCLTTRLEIDDRIDVRAEARATVQRMLAGVSNGRLRRTFLESVMSGVATV